MKARAIVTAVALAAVVLAPGLGWRAWRANDARRHAISETQAERAKLAARLTELEAGRAAAEKFTREAAAELARRAPPKAAAAAPVRPTTTVDVLAAQDQLMKDPKLQVLEMAATRADLVMSYGPFLRGLETGQAARLLDQLALHDARLKDIATVGRANRLRVNDPAVVAQRDQAAAELRAAEIALLGETVQAALQDYKRTLLMRTIVAEFAGSAALVGLPVTAEQGESLALALASADPTFVRGGSAELPRVDWSKADAAVRGVLSAEQWKVYARGDAGTYHSMRSRRKSTEAMARALRDYAAARAAAPKP